MDVSGNVNAAFLMALLMTALAVLLLGRVFLAWFFSDGRGRAGRRRRGEESWGTAQTRGSREIQADMTEIRKTRAGVLAILADGIGRENTGRVCAQIALDAAADAYEPYEVLTNPEYLFRTVCREANARIQKTIGERRGGACLGLAFLGNGHLYYGVVGDIRIALYRGGELIPLSQGHTLDVLARQAYEAGRISKKEAVWSMEEKRRWNYLGMDGFREIEIPERPIRLKRDDLVVMVSRGIWQALSGADREDLLAGGESPQEKARQIVWAAGRKPGDDKENGSAVILRAEEAEDAAD